MRMFHAGELAVQQRMGQAETAARVGRSIRTGIPAVAASFLAEQSMVVLGAADPAGRLWASPLTGPAGFVHAVDDTTIDIDTLPATADPLSGALSGDVEVGLIALQPQRRRRMRVNGTAAVRGGGLRIVTEQVYANCPKYISRRQIREVIATGPSGPERRGSVLTSAAIEMVGAADTFFVATADGDGHADASHRGGNPGFLQVLSPTRLRWPDYRGNSMFMTLGNLAVQPRCGLLVADWSTGALLQLTGRAELVWDAAAFTAGAQCAVDFIVEEVIERPGALAVRWGPPELSPNNP
ncbi:pyridoxamine 5'-phosphate oxidase family protein [Nocardia sp. NPDC058633]|uniref:pyridoxamine 5'-phosphate oxidase family protein n=1 Tax=Nocardia sp. NPDC058633 TaxID=3346568 RepID=UPI003665BDB1